MPTETNMGTEGRKATPDFSATSRFARTTVETIVSPFSALALGEDITVNPNASFQVHHHEFGVYALRDANPR